MVYLKALSACPLNWSDRPNLERKVIGAAVDCCSDTLDEQEVLYATLDPGNQDGCQIFCWFQPESYALSRAEIAQDGQVVITLSFTEFSFQTTEETETK